MTDRRQIGHAGLLAGLLIVGAVLAIQPQMAPPTLLASIQETVNSIEAITSAELSIGAVGIGVVLMVAALGLVRPADGESTAPSKPESGESPQTATERIRSAERSEQFRQYLHEILARQVDNPAQQIRRGTWTDDPVAAATLSEEIEYPVEFRLLYWVDTQRAQDQAYERTASAIAQWTPQSETPNDGT